MAVLESSPNDTWSDLEASQDAIMVDVRTKAEWSFVGIPDLSELNKQTILVEWVSFPQMQRNDDFVTELKEHLDGINPSKIYFMCRSGVRSLAAASLMNEVYTAEGKSVDCINIQEGFEGDLDSHRHRGEHNGWKARGLAWRQS